MEKLSYLSLIFLLFIFKLQAHAITYSIAKPLLEEVSDGHTFVGQKLILKCTFRYRGQFTMDWDVPNENSRSIHFGNLTKTKNEDEYFQDLEIENITIADQGQYSCTVRSSLYVNNVTKIIKIFDPTEHFINLTAENGVYDQLIEEGSPRAKWRINIDAHPIAKLIWYDNNNKEIETGPKYIVMESTSSKKAFLTIKDITMFDKGYYKLKAINDFEVKTIQLFLNVTNDHYGVPIKHSEKNEKKISELINEINQMKNSAKEKGVNNDFVAEMEERFQESRNIWQFPTINLPIPNFSELPEVPKLPKINFNKLTPKLKPQLNLRKRRPLKVYMILCIYVPLLLIYLIAYFIYLKYKNSVK